jgi:putative hydrolase of the HAD superfamily
MYVAAFIFSFMDGELGTALFRAALGATILVPVFCYLVLMVVRAAKPEKSRMADTIVFDLGGVLLDWSFEESASNVGLSEESIRTIREKVIDTGYWDQYDLGDRTRDEITEEILREIPDCADDYRRYLDGYMDSIIPFWYTEDWLKGLKRKGYRIYFLSNWSRECHDKLMESGVMSFIGTYMSGGVWSFEEHLLKPDRAIYERLATKYGLNPGRCVFLDDREVNVKAAREAGYSAIVFQDYTDVVEKLGSIGIRW